MNTFTVSRARRWLQVLCQPVPQRKRRVRRLRRDCRTTVFGRC